MLWWFMWIHNASKWPPPGEQASTRGRLFRRAGSESNKAFETDTNFASPLILDVLLFAFILLSVDLLKASLW